MSPATDYAKPPVYEAVIGVEFAPLPIGLVQLARAFAKWEAELPLAQDAPPLPPVVPANAPAPAFTFELTPGSLNTRYLFASEDQQYLLQLQNDRLLLNWRKLSPDSEYPRYATLRAKFDSYLSLFQEFANEQGLGNLLVRSTEHSYYNRIVGHPVADNILSSLKEPPEPLPGESLFLRIAEVRTLSSDAFGARGELSVNCEPAMMDQDAAMQLAITTRFFTNGIGIGPELSKAFDDAHEVAKTAFERFISQDKQIEWGKS